MTQRVITKEAKAVRQVLGATICKVVVLFRNSAFVVKIKTSRTGRFSVYYNEYKLPTMKLIVHFFQMLVGNVRVHLRGANVAVAEHVLHTTDIGAVH